MTATRFQYLLDCLHQNKQPDGGLAFPAVWQPLKLDYTPASIKRINKLLAQIRTSTHYTSRAIRQKPSGENFIDTLTAYLAEYIARQSQTQTTWGDDGNIVVGVEQFPLLATVCQAIDRPDCAIQLDIPLWQACCFGVDADKKQLRQLILGRFLHKQAIPMGLAHASALTSISFDFSETSLQQIDKLIDLLVKHQQLQPNNIRHWLTQNGAHRNFGLLLGYYIGETVARQLGQTITWNNAHRLAEVVKQSVSADFFDSIVADFGNGVVVPVLSLLEQIFVNPAISSVGWLDYLRQEETQVAEHQPDHTDINQIARRAVDGFLRGQTSDGSPQPQVAYADELREIQLDYSLRSLEALDKLLKIIRTSQPEFTRFVASPHTQNFLHFCAFYLARTLAKLSHNSLKFINYQEIKSLNPNVPNEFFHRYGALIGGEPYLPLKHICAQIWQPDAPKNCVAFAEQVMTEHMGKLYQCPPTPIPEHLPHLPFEWKIALKATGFGIAWALWQKREMPDLMTPILLQPQNTGINLLQLNTDNIAEAMQSGREILMKNPDRLAHQTLIYESYANLPQGRFDAIALEMCVHQGNQPLYLFALLPFVRDGAQVWNGNIALNGETLTDADQAQAVIHTLYQGMDDFFVPNQQLARQWWRESWREWL